MAKTKISEFSATPADNTDITNINIAEGCSPANVNNAIRSLMSLLKNQQDGSSGDPFTVAGTLVASGQVVSSGTLNVTGAFQLDATAGASGQALVSAGGSNTPTWSTLGTMAAQNSTTVAITGGTITGITDLTVADGGTGASSITANSVILGNGTSALSGNLVAPSTSGNVLTSNGTTWTSSPASSTSTGAGTLTATGQTFTITTGPQGKCLINLSASYVAAFANFGSGTANLVIAGVTVASDTAYYAENNARNSGDHAIIAYQYSGSANSSVTVTFTTTFNGTFNKAFYSFIGS
jgi:hypothetical protein